MVVFGEVRRMLVRSNVGQRIHIIGLISIFYALGCGTLLYCANKPLSAGADALGNITILDLPQSKSSLLGQGEPIVWDSCEQGGCKDLLPKDGKIEGKRVVALSPAGENSRGQIVGLCTLEGDEGKHAFVRESDGRIWIFRPPASNGQGEFTDINDFGTAVGVYSKESSYTTIGFLMDSHKQWVSDISYPANPCPSVRSYLHTQPNGINDEGEIVGNYNCTENPKDPADALFKGNGFYRAADGTFYRVQYENAVRTVAGKISNLGVIVGYYVMDNDLWIPFAAKKEDVLKPIIP
jgi:hypothetical protein